MQQPMVVILPRERVRRLDHSSRYPSVGARRPWPALVSKPPGGSLCGLGAYFATIAGHRRTPEPARDGAIECNEWTTVQMDGLFGARIGAASRSIPDRLGARSMPKRVRSDVEAGVSSGGRYPAVDGSDRPPRCFGWAPRIGPAHSLHRANRAFRSSRDTNQRAKIHQRLIEVEDIETRHHRL